MSEPNSRPAPGRIPREAILQAVGDPLSRQVLLMLSEAPRSVNELLQAIPAPQSTLYRRLAELREAGLIGVQRSVLTEDGKKVDLFRSLLEEVDITLRGSSVNVRTRRRDLSAERLADLWGEVRDPERRS